MVTLVDRVDTLLNSLSPARREVLIALKKRGEASASELADELGISTSAVRQHLATLRSSGYVDTRRVRGRPGRPAEIFHSTEEADALFSPPSGTLALELLGDLEAEDPALVTKVFARRGHRRAERFQSELDGLPLADKVVRLTELLDAEGYLTRWSAIGDGGFVLSMHNCAIWNVAERYAQACTTELEFLEDVFVDATVERVVHRRDGSHSCGYEIRPS